MVSIKMNAIIDFMPVSKMEKRFILKMLSLLSSASKTKEKCRE